MKKMSLTSDAPREPFGSVTGAVLTTCKQCNNSGVGDPRDWHHWRHTYKGPWRPASAPQNDAQPVAGTPATPDMPFDAVLRLALINAGVITIEDLQQAQAQMFAITGNIPMSINDLLGGGTDDVPGRSTE
jgi:hypothetical protein